MSQPALTTIHVSEFAAQLAPMRPLIGIDLGDKTLGIALSDRTRMIATALETIQRTKFTADALRLAALIAQHDVGGLVLGLPLNLDGSEGPRVQSTRAFARNLLRTITLPILMYDERLSTVAAERMLIEADVSRKKRKAVIDQVAATIILQGALDGMRAT
jgi:putative holliday junction resolvase